MFFLEAVVKWVEENLLSPFCKVYLWDALEYFFSLNPTMAKHSKHLCFFFIPLSLRNNSRHSTKAKCIHGKSKMGENENVMVKIYFIFLKFLYDFLTLAPRYLLRRCYTAFECERVRLMWKMLLMFNVWQRFLFAPHSIGRWIINEQFWLLLLLCSEVSFGDDANNLGHLPLMFNIILNL